MKKIFLGLTILLTLSIATQVHAYTIGGAYASLIKCEYGHVGYAYGYIGTYNVNGQLYQVFFGNNYCES